MELAQIVVSILGLVGPFIRDKCLGRVVGSTAGFQCFSHDLNRVRRPHLAFTSYERLARSVRVHGHSLIAPELVVLVVAENDLWRDITCKVQDYLAANVEQVWVVDEFSRQVLVFSTAGCMRLGVNDQISCEQILPGFRCQVAEFFVDIPMSV